LLPEIRRSVANDYFGSLPKHVPLSPRLDRNYHQLQHRLEEIDKVEEVQVEPKRVEKWIAAALRDAVTKGYVDKSVLKKKVITVKDNMLLLGHSRVT
jgi:hypothetical protein